MLELGLDFISAIFTQWSTIFFYKKVAKKQEYKMLYKKHIIFMIIIIAAIIQIFLNLNDFKLISPIFTVLYFNMLFKILFDSSKIERDFYTIAIFIINIILDITTMLLMNAIGVANLNISFYPFLKGLSTIVMSILLLAIAHVKPIVKRINNIYNYFDANPSKMKKGVILILIIFYIIIGLSSLENIQNKNMIIIMLIVGSITLYLLLQLFSMISELFSLRKTCEYLEKNDELNRKIIMEYRIFKHNIENQLIGLKSVSNPECSLLINEIIKENNSSFYIKNNSNSIPSGVNGIIMDKLYNYKSENLNINIQNKTKGDLLKRIGSKKYNLLCEYIGITLDNALQAAMNSNDKMIFINFKETEKDIHFIIINTFKGRMDLCQFGKLNYTSKKYGHGIGLYSIFRRKKVDVSNTIMNNLYKTEISIKKK